MENYENEKSTLTSEGQKLVKKNKKVLLIVATITVLVILISLIGWFIIYPKILIKNVNEKYQLEEYDKVANFYNKIKIIRNFINDEEEFNILDYKIKYSKALTLCNDMEYLEAIEILRTIIVPNEISNNLENECNYNIALKYISDNNYSKAIDYLVIVTEKDEKNTLLDQCYYNVALELLEQDQFEDALSSIKKVKNSELSGVRDTEKKIHYEYGKSNYKSKNYASATIQFEKARGYEDAEKYYNNSCILQGEQFISANNFSSAIEVYNKVPDDAECNGIRAGNRKSQLIKAVELKKMMGERKASSTYYETKNVWKYDGRWTNWYIDKTSNEYIDVSLKLNNDGSFNISGKAMFYVYDDFSSLAKYVKAKSTIKYFDFKNVYEIPSEVWLDANTKFSYNNGTYRFDYYVEDNYSTSFYNIYTTNITY